MLEVVLAIAIVSIAIVALVVVTNASLNAVNESRNQAIADQYSRQAIETLRVIRDKNTWNKLLESSNASPTVLQVDTYRHYVLNDASGDPTLEYKGNLSASDAGKDRCSQIRSSSAYKIPDSSNFYREIVMHRLADGTKVEASAVICYGTSAAPRRLINQTILSDWQ